VPEQVIEIVFFSLGDALRQRCSANREATKRQTHIRPFHSNADHPSARSTQI